MPSSRCHDSHSLYEAAPSSRPGLENRRVRYRDLDTSVRVLQEPLRLVQAPSERMRGRLRSHTRYWRERSVSRRSRVRIPDSPRYPVDRVARTQPHGTTRSSPRGTVWLGSSLEHDIIDANRGREPLRRPFLRLELKSAHRDRRLRRHGPCRRPWSDCRHRLHVRGRPLHVSRRTASLLSRRSTSANTGGCLLVMSRVLMLEPPWSNRLYITHLSYA